MPGSWESQGINETNPQWTKDDLDEPYSGYAWYRVSVVIPAAWKDRSVYLNLGRIDDMDWAYVNGSLVGQSTNQAAPTDLFYRSYEVPASAIKFGQPNLIVVRVLDTRGEGGITEGSITLSADRPEDYSSDGGPRGEDKVNILGSVEVGKGETVGDVVAVGGNIIVRGRVNGDAVAPFGNITVKPGAHVNGDVVATFGNVTLEPRSHVDGDAMAVFGTVDKARGAYVGGETGGVGIGGRYWHGPSNWRDLVALDMRARVIKLIGTVLFAALAALLFVLFPARIELIAGTALDRPLFSAGCGLLAAVLAIPLAILLVLTCVGIPLIVIEIAILVAAGVVGHIAIGLAVGRRVGDAIGRPIASGVLATVVGTLILGLIGFVPIAGDLVAWVLRFIGFGAVLVTGFGAHSEWFDRRMWRRTPPPPPA